MRRRVVVVGAGAAGLMAAGQAATLGAETLVLEKMDRPARKLRISGKGRCNLTNTAELEDFLERFGPNGRFLHQAFARFFSRELIEFLAACGIATVTERGGRVFPASQEASDVVTALTAWIAEQGAVLLTGARVGALWIEEGRIAGVRLVRGGAAEETVVADAVVLATGGASYPGTGSSGDGYRLAAEAGHTIVPVRPALVPLVTAGPTAARLQGLSLRHVRARLLVEGRAQAEAFGEMLFTHFGLSGPIVLTLSGAAAAALAARRRVEVAIDLKPALDEEALDRRLRRELDEHGRGRFAAVLRTLLPRTLIPICLEQVGLAPDAACHQITAAERGRLRAWLKELRFEVTGHRPLAEAIVTAGGVDLREVDPRTLASRRCPGLFIAGELLDLDADTGGYNLQAAFSTGWLAGRAAAAGV